MKKLLIALSIILALSLVFVACNKNNEEVTTSPDTTANVTEEATEAASAEETAATTAESTTAGDTTPDTTAEVTTEGITEETTLETTAEETSAEDTSEEETTTERATANPEEVSALVESVESVMAEVEFFQRTDTSDAYLGDALMFKNITNVEYDGLYAHVSEGDGDSTYFDIYFLFDTIHYVNYFDENQDGVVMMASESEAAFFLNEYVLFGNQLSDAVKFFDKVFIETNDDGYTITFSTSNLYETENDLDINITYTVDKDFYVIEVSSESIQTDVGMKIVSSSKSIYSYEGEYVEPITENFDGYTVVDFEDYFGYMDISYGRDLGLDINSDNYVIDYANEARALKQMDFLGTYMDQYVGKSFTMYGIVEEFVEGLYCVNIHGRYITLIPEDGLSLSANSLVCVKGTLECVSESLEAYELNVDSVSVITESDLPEGGYIPWTAYVTAKTLNVRSSADFTADNKVGVLNQNTEVKIIGFIEPKYCMIEYHWETADGQSGEYAFCSLAYLSKLPTFYITLDENYKPVNPPV